MAGRMSSAASEAASRLRRARKGPADGYRPPTSTFVGKKIKTLVGQLDIYGGEYRDGNSLEKWLRPRQ
jgi:hypothetical protein